MAFQALSRSLTQALNTGTPRHDQLREAHRWFTMPLSYADPDSEDLDYLCLAARLRVREALGLPQDRFDRLAFEERELRRAEVR